jgi:hypothetical protein
MANDMNSTHQYALNNTNESAIFNVTYVISDSMAEAVGVCYSTLYGYYDWGMNKSAEFDGGLNFVEAFL